MAVEVQLLLGFDVEYQVLLADPVNATEDFKIKNVVRCYKIRLPPCCRCCTTLAYISAVKMMFPDNLCRASSKSLSACTLRVCQESSLLLLPRVNVQQWLVILVKVSSNQKSLALANRSLHFPTVS